MTSAMSCPCDIKTSACRSFATISSGLCFFFGISVLLHVKRHSSGRTTFQGEDQDEATKLLSGRLELPLDIAASVYAVVADKKEGFAKDGKFDLEGLKNVGVR